LTVEMGMGSTVMAVTDVCIIHQFAMVIIIVMMDLMNKAVVSYI